jgi:hypothetical protein
MVTRTGSQWMGALRLVRNRCIFTSAVLVALRFPGETHKTPRYVSPPLSCNAFTHRTFQQDGVVIAARTSKSISPEFQAGDLEAPGWLLGRYQVRAAISIFPKPHIYIFQYIACSVRRIPQLPSISHHKPQDTPTTSPRPSSASKASIRNILDPWTYPIA